MNAYPPGVPCWVETLQPDARAAIVFYAGLFGWQASAPGPMPGGGEYFVARIADDDVAGIATLPSGGIAHPQWTTYVAVDDVVTALRRATAAGGRTVVEPLDASPAGRLAIVEDPGGATFGLWQARERGGAQRINEPSAWAMSALRTADLDRANAFYGAAFGWTAEPFDAGPDRTVLYRLAGYVGGTPQQPVPRDVVAVACKRPTPPVGLRRRRVDRPRRCRGAATEMGGTVVAPRSTAAFRAPRWIQRGDVFDQPVDAGASGLAVQPTHRRHRPSTPQNEDVPFGTATDTTELVTTKLLSTIAAAALLATPIAASAQDIVPISVEGGVMHTSDGTNAGGAVVTLHGVGVHVPLLSPQVSLAAPLTSGGGRYALTTEAALHVPATGLRAGVGAGVGRLNEPLRTGVLADAFVSAPIAPHAAVSVRYYTGLNHYTGQAIFAGVAVHI